MQDKMMRMVVVVWLCYNFALSIQSDSRCLSGLNEVVAYTIGTVTVKVQRAEAKQANKETSIFRLHGFELS